MRSRARLAIGGFLLVLAAGGPLRAQTQASAEAGFSYLRFPVDRVSALGPTLRLGVRRETRLWYLAAEGGAVATPGAAAGAGMVAGAWRAPVTRRVVAELTAELSQVGGGESRPSSSAVVGVRASQALGDGGTWLRADGGASRRELGALWNRGLSVGAWRRWPRAVLTAALVREWSAGQLFATETRARPIGVVPVRYTEGTVGLVLDGGLASLSASGTLRADPDAPRALEAGGAASMAFAVAPGRAITVGLASQLPDFVRGADAVQQVSVGFRLTSGGAGGRPTLPSAAVVVAVHGDSSSRMLTVRASGAERVEVMGDFTGWEPLALARDGDRFAAPAALTPGTHRMVVRVNGGAWRPAANTPAVDDDFGGRVGLLVVP